MGERLGNLFSGVDIQKIVDDLRKSEKYTKENFENGGFIEYPEDGKQESVEEKKNRETYSILAKSGECYKILPIVRIRGQKNPDAVNLLTNTKSDAKHPITKDIRNAIINGINSANEQLVGEVVFRFTDVCKREQIKSGLYQSLKDGKNPNIFTVILIYNDGYIEKISVGNLRQSYKSAKRRPR